MQLRLLDTTLKYHVSASIFNLSLHKYRKNSVGVQRLRLTKRCGSVNVRNKDGTMKIQHI